MPIQVTCRSCQKVFNAPDSAAGKRAKCPSCGSPIDIPGTAAAPPVVPARPAPPPRDEIFDAEDAPASAFSDEDFDDLEVEAPVIPAVANLKPCPMCGEMIQRAAVKCRHCGEIFDPVLRKQEMKREGGNADSDLNTFEWVIAILCSGIGCIVGIVWIIQGKPKGTKMLIVSIIANVVWGILQTILAVLTEGQL